MTVRRVIAILMLVASLTAPAFLMEARVVRALPDPGSLVHDATCGAAASEASWSMEPTTGRKWRPLSVVEKATRGWTGDWFWVDVGDVPQASHGASGVTLVVPQCGRDPSVVHLRLAGTERGPTFVGVHVDGQVDQQAAPNIYWYTSRGASLEEAKAFVSTGHAPTTAANIPWAAGLAVPDASPYMVVALDCDLAQITYGNVQWSAVRVTGGTGNPCGGSGGGGPPPPPPPPGGGPNQCNDGVDNDADRWVDGDDPSCANGGTSELNDPYQGEPFLLGGEIRWCTRNAGGDQWKSLAYSVQTQIISGFAGNGGVLPSPQGVGVACYLANDMTQANNCAVLGCPLANGHDYPFGKCKDVVGCYVGKAWASVAELRNWASFPTVVLSQVLNDNDFGGACGQGAFPDDSTGAAGASTAWAPNPQNPPLNCGQHPTPTHEMGHNHWASHGLADQDASGCWTVMGQSNGNPGQCFHDWFGDPNRWEVNDHCVLHPVSGYACPGGSG